MIVASATRRLIKGEAIQVTERGEVVGGKDNNAMVNPFGPSAFVEVGEKFYAFLWPDVISGLRHVYEFAGSADTSIPESRSYLSAFAKDAGLSFDAMVEHVKDAVKHNFPFVEQDGERMRDAFYDRDAKEFWDHFENLFGVSDGRQRHTILLFLLRE